MIQVIRVKIDLANDLTTELISRAGHGQPDRADFGVEELRGCALASLFVDRQIIIARRTESIEHARR